jgi:epsilon-lactone hydrolase
MKPQTLAAAFFTLTSLLALAQAPADLDVPARSLPVPTTVSPQMQKLIGAPLNPRWNKIPGSVADWKTQIRAADADAEKGLPALREALKVKVEPTAIDGVHTYLVTPQSVPAANRDRLLVHVHGGCFASSSGESSTEEAIYMAGIGGFKVIAIDYRVPPDYPYPAALDDAMTVWRALTRANSPKKMAIFGSSAGGNLTLAMVLRAKRDGLPLPAAIAPGTPMSDLTNAGDSFQTNAMVDNVLVAPGANCDQRAKLYLAGHDPRDPMVSPVYGNLSGFPPTILTTGTRDLLLSSTVRVHRKLRQVGVEASLQVYEGQSHAHYYSDPAAPETREAFGEIAEFFDRHLSR